MDLFLALVCFIVCLGCFIGAHNEFLRLKRGSRRPWLRFARLMVFSALMAASGILFVYFFVQFGGPEPNPPQTSPFFESRDRSRGLFL